MASKQEKLTAVCRQVRTCFNRLKAVADTLHEDLGVTASMRAVMEALADRSPQTVPAIAAAKSVSRQHIQIIMNDLDRAGLVASSPNPGHRRSPHFALTPKGRDIFKVIARREREPLARVAASMSADSLEHALAALAELNERLADELAVSSPPDHIQPS